MLCMDPSFYGPVDRGASAALRARQRNRIINLAITVVLFTYPGLCTRIWNLLRCEEYVGLGNDHQKLMHLQLTIDCSDGEYQSWLPVVIACLLLYCIGIPVALFLALVLNREALHNDQHPRHAAVAFQLGGLYLNYEPQFYWFMTCTTFYKMIMTGMLAVMQPDTPVQQLVGLLVTFLYMIFFLKMNPFVIDADDFANNVANMSLVVTMLMALCLRMDDSSAPALDHAAIDVIMLIVNGGSMCVQLCNMFFVKTGFCARLAAHTKVAPEKSVKEWR